MGCYAQSFFCIIFIPKHSNQIMKRIAAILSVGASAILFSSCVVYNPSHNRGIPRTDYNRPKPPKKFVKVQAQNDAIVYVASNSK
jgi:hypothetical protein